MLLIFFQGMSRLNIKTSFADKEIFTLKPIKPWHTVLTA